MHAVASYALQHLRVAVKLRDGRHCVLRKGPFLKRRRNHRLLLRKMLTTM
jgi:hypothetical protein